MNPFLGNRDVILISSSNYSLKSKSRLNAHIIASEFAKRGVKVLYVETLGLKILPLFGYSDAFKVGSRLIDFLKMIFLGPQNPEENVFVVSLIRIPFDEVPFIHKLNEIIITFFVARYAKRILKPRPILWNFLPTSSYLAKNIKNSGVVYYCVDDYSSIPFVDKSHILNQEKLTVKVADIIFVVSAKKQLEFKEYTKSPIIYINNVANFELFNKALHENIEMPDDMEKVLENKKPIVGFVGNLATYKEDVSLLTKVAKICTEYIFVIIGAIGEGELLTNVFELKRLPNVYMLGPKNYLDLYKYISYFDVAVIPRKMNAVGEGGFPMKYFEFLSAGKPTVVTGVGNMAQFSKFAQLGGVANTPEKFKERIKYWVELKKNNPKEYEESILARVKIAKQNSWEKRIVLLNSFVSKIIK